MDIRGLVLINGGPPTNGMAFAPAPLALLDIAGMSPLERLAERLRRQGISPVTAVIEWSFGYPHRSFPWPAEIDCRTTLPDRFWRTGENAFNDLAQSGAGLVLVIRLGAYAEIDFERFVQFHLERQCRVSRANCGSQALEVFCLSAFRRNDAASLFRSRLGRCRSECASFVHSGYVNPLADSRDLRQFGVDILTLKAETRPTGREIRPGIWVAPRATIEKGSRILAPAFIGYSARIRAGAVITRCTAIERHAQVDCGTVVENSTVLPYSRLGAGLDLAHSVVGMGHIANLRRGATVEVADEKLLSQTSGFTGLKLLSAVAKLPGTIWRGLRRGIRDHKPDLEDALREPSPALSVSACETKAAGEFSPNLVIARRYGDQ
jgi:hypothetical protein